MEFITKLKSFTNLEQLFIHFTNHPPSSVLSALLEAIATLPHLRDIRILRPQRETNNCNLSIKEGYYLRDFEYLMRIFEN